MVKVKRKRSNRDYFCMEKIFQEDENCRDNNREVDLIWKER